MWDPDMRIDTMMEITHDLVGAGAYDGPTCEELRSAILERVGTPTEFEPLIAHDALLQWVIGRVLYDIDVLFSPLLPHESAEVDTTDVGTPFCGSFAECLTEAAMRAAAREVAMTVSWRELADESKEWLTVVESRFSRFACVGWSLYLTVNPPPAAE